MEGKTHVLSPCHQGRCPPNSEVRDAPKEVKVTGPGTTLAITSSKEPAKESEPSGAVETNEGQNLDASQETVGSTAPKISRPFLLSSMRWEPMLG